MTCFNTCSAQSSTTNSVSFLRWAVYLTYGNTVTLHACLPRASETHFLWSMASDQEKRKTSEALLITLTWKYQNCVTQDMTKVTWIRRFFSHSVNFPLSFHLSILALSSSATCACHLSIISSMPLSPCNWSPFPSCLNQFPFLLWSLYLLLLPLSFVLNTIILSLQNVAFLFTIPDGLTYITYFTVTL